MLPTVVRGRCGHTHTWRNEELLIVGKRRARAQHIKCGSYSGRLNRDDRRLWQARRRRRARGSRNSIRRRDTVVKRERNARRKQEYLAAAEAVLAHALALHMEAVGAAKVQNAPFACRET